MLIRRAEVADGVVRALRMSGAGIEEIAPELQPFPGEDVLDAGGCAVLPGLHDHHVHLRAQAARARSLDVTAVADAAELRVVLHEAQQRLPPGAWLRVVGYHESIAGDLDRQALDDMTTGGTPLRVQHRTGIVWVLNSPAMVAAGLDGSTEEGVEVAAGRIWRRDDLIRRIGRTSARDPLDLASLGAEAAARGVTGFTDATPGGGPHHARDLARDLRAAGVAQRLLLMGPVGAAAPDVEGAALGAVKVLLDDHDLPPLPDLVDTIAAAHAEARAVALHCVTRVQLVLAVAALETAGSHPGDRIEHASVVPVELIGPLAALGVTVVTQPHFVVERGDDYRRDVDPGDVGSLYRVRSLMAAGIGLAAGTDAPFGALDPWASVAAAVERRTPEGHVLGAGERIDHAAAIALYLGHAGEPARARTIAVGQPADLCGLTVPWRALSEAVADRPVRFTVIGATRAYLA